MVNTVVSINIRSATVTSVEVQPRKPRVEIEVFVKDTLTVFGVGRHQNEVLMTQCCYEKKTTSMDAMRMDRSQDGHMDYVKGDVYRTLINGMHMDPNAASRASQVAAGAIINLVETTKETHPSFGTLSLAIHIDCLVVRHGHGSGAPIGDHGYDRLMQRLTETCALCRHDINSNQHVVVPTCHRAYHRACINRCLARRPANCPISEFDLDLMKRSPIRLEL